jgi:multiple sugar transport system permease protein
MESTRRRSTSHWFMVYGGLAIYMFIAFAPIYWLCLTSLRTEKQIYTRTAMLVPRNLTLNNYVYALTQRPLLTWLINSLIVAGLTCAISLVISSLAGYALARLRFPGRGTLARLLVYTYMVPTALLFIPMFVIVGRIGLLDSRTGLILVYLSFTVPFCTWLLFGYFLTIPKELEDAARIDGCSYIVLLIRIVLPLAKPGIAAAFIMAFADAWNEFLYAAVLLTSPAVKTAPIGLLSFTIADNYLWGPLSAAAILMTIPAVILFLVAQKYIVAGLTLGGVKG